MSLAPMPCIKPEVLRDGRASHGEENFLVSSRPFSAFLVVLVLANPRSEDGRNVLRETWLATIPKNVLVRFAVGMKDLPVSSREALERENTVHQDLLMLDDLAESYQTLSSKLLRTFEWIHTNVDFHFLLKVDEDSYTRLDKIIRELETSKPQNKLYWGFFDGRAHVKTKGKWVEKSWNLCDRYLPYALGGGYIISSDLVHYVAENSKLLRTFLSEDVSLGLWLAPLEINRIHDPRFNTEFISRGCKNSYLITHKQSSLQMRELHQSLTATGKLCPQEFRVRKSYVYNWNVLPTMCCIRNDSSVP